MPDSTGHNDDHDGSKDNDNDDDDDDDDEDDCNNDTKVARSSKETVDAMFFLTEEEDRAAR